jgi:alkaline phosphatase D
MSASLKVAPFSHVCIKPQIVNNWDRGFAPPFPNAFQAYQEYIGTANPLSSLKANSSFYDFAYGDAAFFVMDTRSFRTPEFQLPVQHPDKTMLGHSQLSALKQWILDVRQQYTFKFLVSSVPFTFNWHDEDTWYGYQFERQMILDFIRKEDVANVVILSGDRHQVTVVEYEFENSTTHHKANGPPLLEFSVSPLNMFWVPFQGQYREARNVAKATPGDIATPPSADAQQQGLGLSFPDSTWTRDRQVLFFNNGGPINIGRMTVDTATDVQKPVVRFELYLQDPKTPVFQYTIVGRPLQ